MDDSRLGDILSGIAVCVLFYLLYVAAWTVDPNSYQDDSPVAIEANK